MRRTGRFGRALCSLTSLLVLAGAVAITGCAHSYESVPLDVKMSGTQQVALSVLDQRPYIHAGAKGKPADFVGVQYSLEGIPLDVHTASGRPLAEDWTMSVARALEARGFKVQPVVVTNELSRLAVIKKLSETGAPRSILIAVTEWRVEALHAASLKGDVHLEVLDYSGDVIADSRALGRNDLGAGLEGATYARDATQAAYKATLEQLLNDPKVVEALK